VGPREAYIVKKHGGGQRAKMSIKWALWEISDGYRMVVKIKHRQDCKTNRDTEKKKR